MTEDNKPYPFGKGKIPGISPEKREEMLAYLHEALTPAEMEIKLSDKPPVFSPSWEGGRPLIPHLPA